MKRCSTCAKYKDSKEFSKDKNRLDGKRSICRKCCAISYRQYRQKHKEKLDLYHKNYMKSYRLKEYNLSVDEYTHMLIKQRNLCAICFKSEKIKTGKSGQINSLAIDHDHKTGKIRGLLCHACNTSLGLLQDDLLILTNMITYLEKNQ